MLESLNNAINNIGFFTEGEKNLLLGKLKFKLVPKGAFILKEGAVSKSIYFLSSGAFRQYYVSDDVQEVIQNLFIENDWIVESRSFITQKPSNALIQATEDSEVFELNVHDLHDLINMSSSFFRMAGILHSASRTDSITDAISPDAKYSWLLQNKPGFLQKFPLKYIASYLEITPETLSRVRNKISRLH